MKKYKVTIPKEYEVENEYECLDQEGKKRIIIELKHIKKELPKTWEEYLRKVKICAPILHHWRIPVYLIGAFEALAKLVELRDHYNDGWVPDWDEESIKYDICYHKCNIITGGSESEHEVLAFKTVALRDEFLTNFRELIKNAKPLL